MPRIMESPNIEPMGKWARTVLSKKENMVRSPTCKFNPLVQKTLKQPCPNRHLKSPKCYIKITGTRYNGTFLLNIDDGLDDAIFRTMRDIEVALEEQADPMGKPKVCPKNCLSSVFQCFGTSDLHTKAVCNKKKPQKSDNKPAECSLTATINKSDIGPLINAVQSNSFNPSPEISSETVMRDVVDVFRTTLDQFRKENLNSFEIPPSRTVAEPSKQASPKESSTKGDGRTNQVNEELERVSFIKFSQEEVLVIQPPKPSGNDTKELEVGIEVKPKATASNVGQSIKLAKDKVLIGVQDGKGVLQINDGVPKRSIQMVIEEGVNGKPSMKLSLKEEDQDQKELPISKQNYNDGINFRKSEFPKIDINSKYSGNESLGTAETNSDVKKFKSVESQVSWAQLKEINMHSEKQKFKCESTQYHDPSSVQPSKPSHCVCCAVETKPKTTVSNVINQFSDLPAARDPPRSKKDSDVTNQRDSRINRMPYLVHTLYEARSLNSSSAYFASDRPSTHYGSIGKAPISKKFETSKRQIRKPKSFSFSSDYSGSSKCTKIFRDIGEIRDKSSRPSRPSMGKKDAGMTASLIDDFEKILQNMCGSSYLYHHSKPPESTPSKGMKYHEQVLEATKQSSGNLSFDQWTQTESCNQEITSFVEPTIKGKVRKHKTPKIRESGDDPNQRVFKKKNKNTKSNASQRFDVSSTSTSGLEDVFSSDSSKSNTHKLVFSMFAASDGNPLARASSLDENWINEKAESLIGQKIFDAIERNTNHPALFGNVEKTDSFVYPACKDASEELLQGRDSVSVAVNMALYDGPTDPLTGITEEDSREVMMMDEPATMISHSDIIKPLDLEDQGNRERTVQAVSSSRSSYPIRVKSKSCQNLSLTPSCSRSVENVDNGCTRTQIKKLRYPQLTATDATSTLNVCGILNFNEGDIITNEQSLQKLNPRLDQKLPSAVRSLLLPRQHSVIFNNYEHVPTYCCDSLTTKANDYWDLETFNPHGNDWCKPNCVNTVSIHRSVFKRTFFAMKNVWTVVTKKFSNIFRRLSFTHPEKKKKNSAMNDSNYVAIPLKKKSENLHLYPRLQ